MKLEQQVTNLEISKRLEELGVEQESLFDWYDVGNGVYFLGNNTDAANNAKDYSNSTAIGYEQRIVSAFTCAELGEMLPQSVEVEGRLGFLTHWKDNISFRVWYETDDEDVRPNDVLLGLSTEADTEVNARGEMLIYLIENGLCPSPPKT